MANQGVITRKCAYHGCNNRVSSNRSTFPYCHIPSHRAGGEARDGVASGSFSLDARQVVESRVYPPVVSISPRNQAVSLHSRACNLSEQDLNMVLDSYEQIRDGRDFSVPSEIPPDINLSVYDKMMDNGFDGRRIRLFNLTGFNRRRGTKVDKIPHYSHTVIGVDSVEDIPDTVIDGLTPAFAPVRKSQKKDSVEDTIPSGATPYTEYPWIGRFREYMNGDQVWWDSVERGSD